MFLTFFIFSVLGWKSLNSSPLRSAVPRTLILPLPPPPEAKEIPPCSPSLKNTKFQTLLITSLRTRKSAKPSGKICQIYNTTPDAVLQNLSWTELLRLDSKLSSHSKSSKKLTKRLQKNLEKIKKNQIKIEAGEDNRSNKLHSSRQPHLPKLRYLATSSRIYWNLWSRSYFQIRH